MPRSMASPAEPTTPPPAARTPPVTPADSPGFSTEATSKPYSPPATFSLDDAGIHEPMDIPPPPDDANSIFSTFLGAEIVCCGKRLGLRKAKRLMVVMGVAMVLLLAVAAAAIAFAVESEETVAATPAVTMAAERSEPCGPPSPCLNGGKCHETGPGSRRCACRAGFIGAECEINMATCLSSPCTNGATCVDGADEYHCVCAQGFVGEGCEVDVLAQQLALCAEHVCQNGGHCQAEALSGAVSCECSPGFSGDRCQQHADSGMASYGNGVDIADMFSSDGSLSLKFAPLFERLDAANTQGGPLVSKGLVSEAAEVVFYKDTEEFLRSLTAEVDLPYQQGMLAADVWVADIRQHSYSARPSSIYGKATRRFIVEEKIYPTTLRLHPGLSQAIASLPSSIEPGADLDAYFDFLVTFGTHFVSQQTFGGKIEWEVFVGNATSLSLPALEDRTREVFERLLGNSIGDALSGAEMELQAAIPQISRTQFRVLGGRASAGDFDAWTRTVGTSVGGAHGEPELIGINLMSIAELAPSFSKKRLISRAIEQWLAICAPPGGGTSGICSDRGTCGILTGRCMCDMGFHGAQCELQDCPSRDPASECSGHGVCDSSTGSCTCLSNSTTGMMLWRGDDCDSDVNECRQDKDLCAQHRRECINTPGTYYCGNCLAGFAEDDNGFCIDIDECADRSTCEDVLSTCRNSVGSYSCVECTEGFAGLDCEEIDECSRPNNECSVNNQACENTHAGFSCGDCLPGYEMSEVAVDGTGQSFCIDVDECVANEGLCGPHAECVNTEGRYECECHGGYSGDGHNCEPVGCVATTLHHARNVCEGATGDECELECISGYISTGSAVCNEDGTWSGASCLFECQTLQLEGDCFLAARQEYAAQEELLNGKPHYVGSTIALHIYWDPLDHVWLLDDDTDTAAIHGHLRTADVFPTGRRLWTTWCGPYYGWSEIVIDLACSGVCEDTCAGFAHDGVCDDGGPGDADPDDPCTFGTDCADCGTRISDGMDACHENLDLDGHTCSQYASMGYPCFELVYAYHKDCSCTCPQFYGSDNEPEEPADDTQGCPCPVTCAMEIVSYQDGEMRCDCRGC